MRRLAFVTAGLVLPLLPSVPAFATDHVICVGAPAGPCDETVATIPLAVAAAGSNGLANTIFVGTGTYSDGPYLLDGTTHALTLKGSGAGTILTLPASGTNQTYLTADDATVQDLTITMAAGSSDNDRGLLAYAGSTVNRVAVGAAGTTNATGIQVTNGTVSGSSVTMPVVGGTRAIYSGGGNTVTDVVLVGSQGYAMSASTADSVSRATITAASAVTLDSGTIAIDDSVIDLGTTSQAIGLEAANYNGGTTPKTITATHVTIVGGGTGSRGAYAYAAFPTASQQSTINLDSSIIEGPETDLLAEAGNNGGPLAASTATVNATYSEWGIGTSTIGPGGAGGVVMGVGNLDVVPAFVNPAGGDLHLAAGSLLIDAGNPAAAGFARDRDGSARVTDGDGDGIAVRDMGAYERPASIVTTPKAPDTAAPDTAVTSRPHRRVTKRRVTFGFASTEGSSTFQCKLDGRPWRSCTSPTRYRVTIGWHRFRVRASDPSGNTDPLPASFRFRRVR
jgi:hypothetical protein